ncbi:hypothetical protein SDC9_155857 [bioreactor metagenome]|uniref:DUF1648 domain-containing protein n=1 Tax=bioreactor metagenome TaxID=1076179 RepID=A0A645F7I6_9ZZZZ
MSVGMLEQEKGALPAPPKPSEPTGSGEKDGERKKMPLPAPQPVKGACSRGLDLLALGLVLLLLALFWYYYPQMPAKVPIYFGAEGQVSAWSRRSFLGIYPILGLVFFLVLTRLIRRPDILNFGPVKITQQNHDKQYRMARKFLVILRFLMLGLLNIMFYNTAYAALSGQVLITDSVTTMLGLAILISPFIWRSMAARL